MRINTSRFLLGCLGVPPILKCISEYDEVIHFNRLALIAFTAKDK